MKRFKLFIVCLCIAITTSELLGPQAKVEDEPTEDENEISEDIDTEAKVDQEYIKQLTEAMNKEILTLKEYAESMKEDEEDPMKKQSRMAQMEHTLSLLRKTLLKHPVNDWIHSNEMMDLAGGGEGQEKQDEDPQDLLNSLPPLQKEEEVELSPSDQAAKELFEAAEAKLIRRTPDVRGVMLQVKEAADAGWVPAKIRLAWAHLFGEGVEQDLEKAKETFLLLASHGNPEAHAGLGFMYATGVGVPVSQARALVYYTTGALGDSSFAQMALAYRYWSGVTVPNSCPKAMHLYMKVAAKVASKVSLSGGPAIQRVRLIDEAEGGSGGALDTDLIEYYQLLAEKGDVQAQVGLGQLHFQGGRGVTLDLNKALHYFQQAANAGNAVANAFLGKIYLEGGDGIKADNETALRYFKKAAELNNPVGLSGLGIMYLQGRGVPKDTNAAFKYFTMAANQGWVEGQLHLGFMYFGGIGVRRDFKQANKYFSLASQSGHVLALYHLAHMHAQGLGVLASCTTAVELFKSVCERGVWGVGLMSAQAAWRQRQADSALIQYLALAERGYEVAQSNAAYLLDNGEVRIVGNEGGLERTRWERALQQWRRAAAQGCSAARVKLGDYYYYGLGTAQDLEAAAHHYRIASEQLHNAQATFNLGYMHERGLGLAQDLHLAKRCYDLAADTSPDARLPAALALARLNAATAFSSFLDSLLQSPLALIFLTGGESMFLNNWDLYLITALLGALGVVIYLRRPQPQPAQ